MPDEALISEIENLLSQVIELGGQNERSQVVPNLTVQNANPTGLTDFVIVSDDRDGDNILAQKVGSVVYSNNDKVNVLFVKGGEAIAFQQGSQSSNSGIWEIVPSTSTDIFYDKGDVGIGKSVAPDATLEVLDTSQAQLRLTHTEDTKFVDFTLNTSHNLTIDISSTGKIISEAPLIVTGSDTAIGVGDSDGAGASPSGLQFLDTGTKNVGFRFDGTDLIYEDASASFAPSTWYNNTTANLQLRNGTLNVIRDGASSDIQIITYRNSAFLGLGSFRSARGSASVPSAIQNGDILGRFGAYGYHSGAAFGIETGFFGFVAAENYTSSAQGSYFRIELTTAGGVTRAEKFRVSDTGDVGVGTTVPAAKLHVDQASTTVAIPVLYLDQADLSEEMIEFNTTIGVGNPIEAVGAKTLTTTHFIKVTLPGALTRYIPVGTIA